MEVLGKLLGPAISGQIPTSAEIPSALRLLRPLGSAAQTGRQIVGSVARPRPVHGRIARS